MKILYDLLPVILFFITFKMYDIFIATGVAIIVTLIQIVFTYSKNKKVDKMLLFNGIIITLLGGLTILFKDETFIIWKPSVIYWLLSVSLLISDSFFNKNLIKLAMGSQIKVQEKYWKKINLFTSIFFLGLGFINLYVGYNFDLDTWVNFKLFGITALLLIYILTISLYLTKVSKD